MITIYRKKWMQKAPGCWYVFTYSSGQRVSTSEYQGDLGDLESQAIFLSVEKGREVRLVRIEPDGSKRIVAVCRNGRMNNGLR